MSIDKQSGADEQIACSDCGLTMRESKLLVALQAQPSAPANPDAMQFRLSEQEAGSLRDVIGDSRSITQAVTLKIGDGHSGFGLYAWSTEYPDDGSWFIKSIAVATPADMLASDAETSSADSAEQIIDREFLVSNLAILKRDPTNGINGFGEDWASSLAGDALALLEQYDDVLRGLALWLSAGGYNSEGLIDPKTADEKIRWGVDNLCKSSATVPSEPVAVEMWNRALEAAAMICDTSSLQPAIAIRIRALKQAAPSTTEQASDVRNFDIEKLCAAIMLEVEGNIRPTVRDCVNGADDVQDIYKYCDTIESFIKSALKSAPAAKGNAPAVDIEQMVNRFLGWKLPQTFAPDCGILFKQVYADSWPTGTNLFHAGEAKAMFEHCLATPAAKGNAQDEVKS